VRIVGGYSLASTETSRESAPKTDVDVEERKLVVQERDLHAQPALDLAKLVAIMIQRSSQLVRRDNHPTELW
jgi:hypothetical protein